MARAHGLLLLGVMVSFLLRSGLVNFSAPIKDRGGLSRSQQKGTMPKPRSDLPRQVLELPKEEKDEEPVTEKIELEKRLPYTINIYTPTESETNYKYLQGKLIAALENTQNWVDHVEARLTIEHHAHSKPSKHFKANDALDPIEAEEVFGDAGVQIFADQKTEVRTALTPYRLEVTVKLKGEGTVVITSSKHASESFMEAVDTMYDMVRRKMRKEKGKRLDKIRHHSHFADKDMVMDGLGDDDDDDIDGGEFDDVLDEGEEARLDAEAEKAYSAVEEAQRQVGGDQDLRSTLMR